MQFRGRWRWLAVLVVFCLVAAVSGSAGVSAQDGPGSEVSVDDIVLRDELIAAQESLLNTYRCLFNVDVEIVPGGCTNGQPARGPTEPAGFEGVPSQRDVKVRDGLVEAQESLLNVYRCLFDVDTQIVPGGCVDEGEPAPINRPGDGDGPGDGGDAGSGPAVGAPVRLEVPGSATVSPVNGQIDASWEAADGLDGGAQSYLLQWREAGESPDVARGAVLDGLSYVITGLTDVVPYVVSVGVSEVNRTETPAVSVTAIGDMQPTVEQVVHPESVNTQMEVSPFAEPVSITVGDDVVWPLRIEVPVDTSKVAAGDFLYLMHRPSLVGQWLPVEGARFDAARDVIVADVSSEGLFMPIRAKSDVAAPQELDEIADAVPDLLRGYSRSDHPIVRFLQGDPTAAGELDEALLGQYLKAILEGLEAQASHGVPQQLADDLAALVELTEEFAPSAAIAVPTGTAADRQIDDSQGLSPLAVVEQRPGAIGDTALARQTPAANFNLSASRNLSFEIDITGLASYPAYWIGRGLGTRSSRPSCDTAPPSWVKGISTVDDLNTPVFACGSTKPADELRDDLLLNIVSNRGYPIMLELDQRFGDTPRYRYEGVTEVPNFPSVKDALLSLLGRLLPDYNYIYLTATDSVTLQFFKQDLRPNLYLDFKYEDNGALVALEVLLAILASLIEDVNSVTQKTAKIEAAWNCVASQANLVYNGPSDLADLINLIVDSCQPAITELVEGTAAALGKKAFNESLKAGLAKAAIYKLAADVSYRLADFFVDRYHFPDVSPVALFGENIIRSNYVAPAQSLGDWDPACTSPGQGLASWQLSANSKNFYINLAARQQYSNDSRSYLYEFSSWAPDSKAAATALIQCGAEDIADLARYVLQDPDNYWTEPESTKATAEEMLGLFGQLGFGDWTASCANAAADIAAVHADMAAQPPFNQAPAGPWPAGRYDAFKPALKASAEPLTKCDWRYLEGLHSQLPARWPHAQEVPTAQAVIYDLILDLPISVADANLKTALKKQLRKTETEDITIRDARNTTGLNIANSKITNLAGLEHFINLQSLNASDNQIANLAPLPTLPKLVHLNLSDNQIRDITALNGQTRLRNLNVSNNLLTKLTFDNLPTVRTLNASDNNITRVSLTELPSLAAISNLSSNSSALNLDNNPIQHLKLAGLTNLTTINLNNYPQLTTLKLSAAPEIQSIQISNNKLTRLALADLPELVSLNADNNLLSSVELTQLPKLGSLRLNDNQLTELALNDFPSLYNVTLQGNALETLVLTNLASIRRLYTTRPSGSSGVVVHDNPIKSLTVANLPTLTLIRWNRLGDDWQDSQRLQTINLTGLPELTSLEIAGNQLTQLDIAELPKLAGLYANNNHITSLGPSGLSQLPELRILRLNDNQLTELALNDFPSLYDVTLQGNALETLVLTNLASVRRLYTTRPSGSSGVVVHDNPIKSLTVANLPTLTLIRWNRLGDDWQDSQRLQTINLTGLPELTSLEIAGNQLTQLDIAELSAAPEIQSIQISNNKLTRLALADLPELVSLNADNNLLSSVELTQLPKLGSLRLNDNQLTELALNDFPSLYNVTLQGNALETLVLTNLASIRRLYTTRPSGSSGVVVHDNPIKSLTVANLPTLTLIRWNRLGDDWQDSQRLQTINLTGLPELTSLEIAGNQLTQLDIAELPKLAGLHANNNHIVDISAIGAIASLVSLSLENNDIGDVSPLAALVNLRHLGIANNLVSDFSVLAHLTDLTTNGQDSQRTQ